MTGQTISHYEVLEKLGSGGMGEVWKAEDVKLQRPVALKFLAASSLGDEATKDRFLHEARAAASLDHPNICGIYEIDEADGRLFMVMPFLEGDSLDKRIAQGPRPLGETLQIAIQTGEALEAAHAKQVVHRDIKPANVMVAERREKRVHCILMDFGIARLTQATKLTREGSRLGTAAYMSPEQTQGSSVDKRTDIWALGVVIYEMAVGRLPFSAEYEQALFYGILSEDPEPITALRTGLPMELERIVAKCLAKAPEERYQSATDLLVDLRALQRASETTAATRIRPSTEPADAQEFLASAATTDFRKYKLSLGRAALFGVCLTAATAAITWWILRPSGSALPHTSYEIAPVTFDSGLSAFPALSPDGSLVAYTSDRGGKSTDIWVQRADGGSAVQLTDHPAEEMMPSFSPDGSKIVFFRADRQNTGVYVVPALGGDARFVAPMGLSPRFSPGGESIAYIWEGDLHVVPANGGNPRRIEADLNALEEPLWSPDGRYLLVYGRRESDSAWDLWRVDLEDEDCHGIGLADALSELIDDTPESQGWSWGRDGVVFSAGGDLWRAPLSAGLRELAGPLERLTFGSGNEILPAASSDDRVAFVAVTTRLDIWSLPLDARADDPAALQPLTESDARDASADLSLSRERLVYLSNRTGAPDVWTMDLESGREINLTDDAETERYPIISPDGSLVAYGVSQDDKTTIRVRPFTDGLPEDVCSDCGDPRSWSPDNRFILFQKGQPGVTYALSLGDGTTAEVLKDPEGRSTSSSRISPDGRWVAFKRDPGQVGVSQVFVAPFRGMQLTPSEEWIQITPTLEMPSGREFRVTFFNEKPRWRPDGNAVYLMSSLAGSLDIFSVRLDPLTKHPLGEPSVVKRFPAMRHSLQTMGDEERELAVGRKRLVFPLNELRGRIWIMTPRGR